MNLAPQSQGTVTIPPTPAGAKTPEIRVVTKKFFWGTFVSGAVFHTAPETKALPAKRGSMKYCHRKKRYQPRKDDRFGNSEKTEN